MLYFSYRVREKTPHIYYFLNLPGLMHVKSSTETCVLCSRPQGRACFVQGLKGRSSRIAWLINGKKTNVDLWAMQRGWEGLEMSARRQLGPYRLLPLSFYYTLRVLLPREFLSHSCIICVYRVYYYLLSSASSRQQRPCVSSREM